MKSSVTGNIDDGIPSSSSDSARTSKRKKNCRATFKIQMGKHHLSLKAEDDELFNNRFLKPAFVLKPVNSMLNLVVNRISIQKLEYEMDRADLPDNCIF